MQIQTNTPYLTVGELSQAVKRTVETAFDHVRVRGEISQPRIPGSGHLYFTLKDDKNALAAVMWKGMVGQLSVKPEEGLDVICTGKMTTFGGQSKYQIVVQDIEIAGEGALLKQLEERKRRLAEEGLFDQSRKKQLPFLPKTIGVVTSPTGAVINDILHRLSDRFGVHVLLWGVAVQGTGAAEQIAAAINGFNMPETHQNTAKPDLIIVARGGGSLEDLWAFNEEVVARAVAESKLPVISAVGHETDTTLIDYVSDLRAPTPTAAAELATPVKLEIMARLQENQSRLLNAVMRRCDGYAQLLKALSRGLLHPADLLGRQGQRLDMLTTTLESKWLKITTDYRNRVSQASMRLISPAPRIDTTQQKLTHLNKRHDNAVLRQLEKSENKLDQFARLLNANSFERVLDRGFALVTDTQGKAMKRSSEIADGAEMNIRFADASRKAVFDVTSPPSASPSPASSGSGTVRAKSTKTPQKSKTSGQEELF